MENGKVFRTKTGFCHILNDKIVLTRDGVVGNIANAVVGKGITRILLINGVVSVGLLYSAYVDFMKGELFLPVLYGLLGGWLIYGVFSSLNNSATLAIERSTIIKVKFRKAIAGLTRSVFIVFFMDKNGKEKKRVIMLPGSMTGGKEETGKAMNIMKEEGLID